VEAIVLPPFGVTERIGMRGELSLPVVAVVEPGLKGGSATAARLTCPNLDTGDAPFFVVREPELSLHAVYDSAEDITFILELDLMKARVADRMQCEPTIGQRRERPNQPIAKTPDLKGAFALPELESLAAMKAEPTFADGPELDG
jgi:hypothetical protein